MDELNASHSHSNNEMISYNTPPNDVLVADLQPPSHAHWNEEYDGDDDDDGHDDTDDDYDDDNDHHSYISRHNLENQNIEELAPQDIDIINNDAANQREASYLIEPVSVAAEPNNALEQTSLELFKYDVVCLLNLLINEKFGHPFGAIAGAVA